MDLKTKNIDGYMWPYCVSIYDGKEVKSLFLLDCNDNTNLMLEDSIKYLMVNKYNKYYCYLHNFSYFDSIFLIKTLSNLSNKIIPIMRDGNIINFKVYFNKNNHINFRDSLLLLPSALKKYTIFHQNKYLPHYN